jgi:hypothetical protein
MPDSGSSNIIGAAPARERMRVGGYRPDIAENLQPGEKVAGHLQKYGIGAYQARNMTTLGRRSHMQNAGLQLQDIDNYGDDIWEHALHILSQS